MLQDTTAVALEKVLTPSDLRLRGKALYRKIVPALHGTERTVFDMFHRVEGDPSTLLVRLANEDLSRGQVYFLSRRRGRIHAFKISVSGEWGAYCGTWRRRGDRIVGLLSIVQGNWAMAGAVLLRRQQDGWRVADVEETPHESGGISFVGSGVSRIHVSMRRYDLRAFAQSHAGPLQTQDALWRVGASAIRVGRYRNLWTPLDDVDRFADAALRGDHKTARLYCRPSLLPRAWSLIGRIGRGRIVDEDGRRFGIRDRTADEPTVYFEMARWRGGWRIARLLTASKPKR